VNAGGGSGTGCCGIRSKDGFNSTKLTNSRIWIEIKLAVKKCGYYVHQIFLR